MITASRKWSSIARSYRSPPAPSERHPLLVHLIIASPSASSPGASRSRRLADAFLEGLRETGRRFTIAELDVFEQGHSLDLAAGGAAAYHASMHRQLDNDETHSLAALDLVLDPLLRCDLLVIASPVWNFGPPWRLKQWIDCVAQPGKTFRYSVQGSRGLLSCRGVVLATLGGARMPQDANSLFLEQMGATMTLMGVETLGQVVADSLDVDPSQTEPLLAAACEEAKRFGTLASP